MNLYDLREKLVHAFNEISEDKMSTGKAKALVGTADKIISTVKTQIKYHEVRGEKPEIPFVALAAGK